jgi:hypothetical protein
MILAFAFANADGFALLNLRMYSLCSFALAMFCFACYFWPSKLENLSIWISAAFLLGTVFYYFEKLMRMILPGEL